MSSIKLQTNPNRTDLIGGIIFIGLGVIRIALYLFERKELRPGIGKASAGNSKSNSKTKEPAKV